MSLPILYSFRRCPYAMRLDGYSQNGFPSRTPQELSCDRPAHMMEISPKGQYQYYYFQMARLSRLRNYGICSVLELISVEREWVNRNDEKFKFHLDRYKYHRYDDVDHIEHREAASKFIQDLNEEILKETSATLFSRLSDNLRTMTENGSIPRVGIMCTRGLKGIYPVMNSDMYDQIPAMGTRMIVKLSDSSNNAHFFESSSETPKGN